VALASRTRVPAAASAALALPEMIERDRGLGRFGIPAADISREKRHACCNVRLATLAPIRPSGTA
jgi:hypothetical protein